MRSSRARAMLLVTLALATVGGCSPAPSPTPAAPTTAPTPTPAATANAVTTPIALTVVSCVDPTKQLCAPAAGLSVWTEGALVVTFTASPGHCSPVIAHVLLDGAPAFVSEPLAPGASTGPHDVGPVSPGQHRIDIQAEGVAEGCNSGGVSNWSGSVELGITAGAEPYPTPRLETPKP